MYSPDHALPGIRLASEMRLEKDRHEPTYAKYHTKFSMTALCSSVRYSKERRPDMVFFARSQRTQRNTVAKLDDNASTVVMMLEEIGRRVPGMR